MVNIAFFSGRTQNIQTSKPGSEVLCAKIVTENSQKMHALMQGIPRYGDTSVAIWTNAQECQLQTTGFPHYQTIYLFEKKNSKGKTFLHIKIFSLKKIMTYIYAKKYNFATL